MAVGDTGSPLLAVLLLPLEPIRWPQAAERRPGRSGSTRRPRRTTHRRPARQFGRQLQHAAIAEKRRPILLPRAAACCSNTGRRCSRGCCSMLPRSRGRYHGRYDGRYHTAACCSSCDCREEGRKRVAPPSVRFECRMQTTASSSSSSSSSTHKWDPCTAMIVHEQFSIVVNPVAWLQHTLLELSSVSTLVIFYVIWYLL
jgi:hypothetical protein